MKELPQKLDIKQLEAKWQKEWAEKQTYAFDESLPRSENFVIDTPPPTVSGSLHMGHIFSYTQADFVARYQRMKGKNVFYPMGFDDNGLPTERLVEKTLKTRATDHSREDFIKMCEGVAETARKDFRALFTSTALSVDWNQEYHTISDDVIKLSQMSFLDLVQKGEAYRKHQPMFWDPVDQTAIANAEIEEKEHDSFENYIYFGLVAESTPNESIKWDELEKVEIMTTRPEMLPACVALMCHPDDAAKYHGKKAVTPLFNVAVPIIADDKVAKDKGTGLVMCCTFGDETDIHWWKKHNLDTRIILNKFGKLASLGEAGVHGLNPEEVNFPDGNIPTSKIVDLKKFKENYRKIQNLKTDHQEERLSARKTAIRLLEENGLTSQSKIAIKHAVKCAERSGSPLEIIPTNQWFIKVVDKKEELKAKAQDCEWHPAYMYKRVEQWIDSLSWDWCISRQRYFGVPFPVWFSKRSGEEGKIIFADKSQLPVNPLVDLPKGYSKDEVTPEADVMDTWATSSISPQISSKGINDEFCIDQERHHKLFPADIRPQAHEIIRTWAFYTIVKAHLHENTIPWKNLMISGWCLASDKTKMSKSKGNVITPQALIADKGADSIRYWSSTSRLGSDTAFSEDVLKIGNKLVNKLWNATKFASIQFSKLEGNPVSAKDDIAKGIITETLDKWVISRLYKAVEKATKQFDVFEYADARAAVEDFFWNDFCDNYLEIVKVRSYDEAGTNPKGQKSAIHTIYHCINAILKLFAPFTPHITEELYSHVFDAEYAKTGSIHARGNWPKVEDFTYDETSETSGIITREILDIIRKVKAEANVSVKFPLSEIVLEVNDARTDLNSVIDDLKNVTSAEKVVFSPNSGEKLPSFNIKVAAKLGEKKEAA